MPDYPIQDSYRRQWGVLRSHIALPDNSADVLGAGLDIAVYGLQIISRLLRSRRFIAELGPVRKALYIYFDIRPLPGPGDGTDEALPKILDVIDKTWQGLLGEHSRIEIIQNEANTSPLLNGYVVRYAVPLIQVEFAAPSSIHINFPKIMGLTADLGFGGAYWPGLIVHEATHKYAATTDLIDEVVLPGGMKTSGYLEGQKRSSTITHYEGLVASGRSVLDARRLTVCPKINSIKTAQHLRNADSYTWLFISILQAYEETFYQALVVANRSLGRDDTLALWHPFRTAAARFVELQRLISSRADPMLAAVLNLVYYEPR